MQNVLFNKVQGKRIIVDKNYQLRVSAKGFESEGSGPGKKIENFCLPYFIAKYAEKSFSRPVRGWTDSFFVPGRRA